MTNKLTGDPVFDYFLGDCPEFLTVEEMQALIKEKLGTDVSHLGRKELDAIIDANLHILNDQ